MNKCEAQNGRKKEAGGTELGGREHSPPGSYAIEGEVLLLRVRLKGTAILCLIDVDRRVKEIFAAPVVETPSSGPRLGRSLSTPPGPGI